jgi:hypothetical protein
MLPRSGAAHVVQLQSVAIVPQVSTLRGVDLLHPILHHGPRWISYALILLETMLNVDLHLHFFSMSSAAANPSSDIVNNHSLKRNSNDVGWEYGVLIDPNDFNFD